MDRPPSSGLSSAFPTREGRTSSPIGEARWRDRLRRCKDARSRGTSGSPITGATGSFARGHGNINLAANTVSGVICQVDRVRNQPDRLIIMSVRHHLVHHSHFAVMWGVPGNIMQIIVRVQSSTDAKCAVGTVGHATLFASYNNVRSDSVQFFFPAACGGHDHLYHGTQVNNQVPPL